MLALPIFGMVNYVRLNSGAGCEANGAGSITTLAGCSAAAAWLGLSDTTAENDNKDGNPFWPPECYVENNYVMFNSAGTNTGNCSSFNTCICSSNGPQPPVLVPAELNLSWSLLSV